jgi:hypothetical protein
MLDKYLFVTGVNDPDLSALPEEVFGLAARRRITMP